MLCSQHPTSIPPASLGLLGPEQAHLSVPHCPASKLLAVLAHHKAPERSRDADHLRHTKDALTLCVSPHGARVAPKVAKAASKAGKVTAGKAEEGLVTGGRHSPDQRHKLES